MSDFILCSCNDYYSVNHGFKQYAYDQPFMDPPRTISLVYSMDFDNHFEWNCLVSIVGALRRRRVEIGYCHGRLSAYVVLGSLLP